MSLIVLFPQIVAVGGTLTFSVTPETEPIQVTESELTATVVLQLEENP